MFTRNQMVELALKYKGAKKGSARHKDLVDTFNRVKPSGEVANYTCPWCAITVTALAIKGGFTQKNFPMDYNCGKMVDKAKSLGIWVESDSYKPKKGDLVLYDWQDSGKGENKGTPDHVGIVVSVNGNKFDVLEGNKGTSSAVGIRNMVVNGRYIRGFVVPKYSSNIKFGSNGKAVKDWQTDLNTLGYKLVVDGEFGEKTQTATKNFQKAHKIAETGEVGSKTKLAMKNALNLKARKDVVAYGRQAIKEGYDYMKYSSDPDTHKCSHCNKILVKGSKVVAIKKSNTALIKKYKADGYKVKRMGNCIGFASQCLRHGGGFDVPCHCAGLGNDAWFTNMYAKSSSEARLKYWQSRHGKEWKIVKVPRIGCVVLFFKKEKGKYKYKHTAISTSATKMIDCTSSGGARERLIASCSFKRFIVFMPTGKGKY